MMAAATRLPQLAIQVQHLGQLLLAIGVEQFLGCERRVAVHAHIEWSIGTEGEATLHGNKMVERHTQVGKNAVNTRHTIVAQEIFPIGKIAVCKCKPRIVQTVLPGIHILVKTDEVALRAKVLHNATTMAATAKGNVHVSAIRLDGKPSEHFVEQRRYVIHSLFH